MSHHDPPDLPEAFRPQNLRGYVASYADIARPACIAAASITKGTATKGAINYPDGRRTPQFIAPWSQADRSQERAIIDSILSETDNAPLSLPEKKHVERVGEELVRIDSESALLLFDANTLHASATRILRGLLANERIRTSVEEAARRTTRPASLRAVQAKALRPGNITFPTHRNIIPLNRSGTKRKRGDDPHEHVLQNLRSGPADVFAVFEHSPNTGSSPNMNGNISMNSEGAGTEQTRPSWELLLIKEAKAPHKLTVTMIDKAVGRPNKILEPDAIMSRGCPESSPGSMEPDTEESEYWFAAVCTQLYSSMIQQGLRYGVITTGVCYIFVSIDPDSPSTLRYSISHNTRTSDIYESPLLRLVTLVLRALQSGGLEEGDLAVRRIYEGRGLTWTTPSEFPRFSSETRERTPQTESWGPSPARLGGSDSGASERGNHTVSMGPPARSMRDDPHHQGGPASILASVSYPPPPHEKPSVLGKRHRHGEVQGMRFKKQQRLQGSSVASVLPTTPASSPPNRPAPAARRPLSEMPYCNTACLQLLSGNPDEFPSKNALCPNHTEHERHARLTHTTMRQQIKDQIENPIFVDRPDGYLRYSFMWQMLGSHSVMVKLEVNGHVLLGKAFQPQGLKTMYREARIYQRLRHLQGGCIPVCLGAIELSSHARLDYNNVDLTGLLLLGFGGYGIHSWPHLGLGIAQGQGGGEVDRLFVRELTAEVQKGLSQVHEAGVLHRDMALRNVLLHRVDFRQGPGSQAQLHLQVRLIDFELSRTKLEYRARAERRGQKEDVGVGLDARTHAGDVEFAEASQKEMRACADIVARWCHAYH